MKALIENINQVLSEWDPIGVGETIATDEYRGYIPIILRSVNNKKTLIDCLEIFWLMKWDWIMIPLINHMLRICSKFVKK
jgi:hypothetical protein